MRTEHPTQVPAGLLPVGSGAEEGRENAEESRVLGHCSAADVCIRASHGRGPAVLPCH